MQVKNQQLEPDLEQRTCSKSGKEYVKAVYSHSVCLTYMQSEMPGWMNHQLETRWPGEIAAASNMQMTPPYGRERRGTKEPSEEMKEESKALA